MSSPDPSQLQADNDDDVAEKLQRLQEENFDLQATIAALQAEKQFEILTLQQTAASNESKWRADLRLAQQDAQRWKSMAQQGSRPKSIVSSSSSSTLIHRQHHQHQQLKYSLAAAAAAATTASVADSMAVSSSYRNEAENGSEAFSRLPQSSFPDDGIREKDLNDAGGTASIPDFSNAAPSTHRSKNMDDNDGESKPSTMKDIPPPYKRRATVSTPSPNTFYPTRHLASNLLTHTTQETSSSPRSSSKNPPSPERIQQDSYIRQVLIGVACGTAGKLSETAVESSSTTSADSWTEEYLIEWLICQQTPMTAALSTVDYGETMDANDQVQQQNIPSVTDSLSPADKYWSLAMAVSPAARQHVIKRVQEESTATAQRMEADNSNNDDDNDTSKMDIDPDRTIPAVTLSSHRRGQRGRKFRIQPLGENRNQDLFHARLEAARKALRNPFWDPNTPIPYPPQLVKDDTKELFSQASYSKPFQTFVQILAASCYIPHLQTVQILLEEASGDNDVTSATATVWWDLCYGPIATTIQRIVFTKLTQQPWKKEDEFGKENANRGPNGSSYRSLSRGSSAESIGKTTDRRNRIKNINGRLDALNGATDNTFTISSSVNEKDELLEHTLGVLLGLLRVVPIDKLDKWYQDTTGWEHPEEFLCPPGGKVLVSLLLDLMEYLLFVEWKRQSSPMHPKQVLTAGGLRAEGDDNIKQKPAETAIPRYYLVGIAILQQVGRTLGGMKLLRTRVKDDLDYDIMGSALDVSIRHLQALAWHWENHKVMEGAVVCLNDDKLELQCGICKQKRDALVDAVENWIRLWHQVLLFVQQSCHAEDISFRALVVDLQDHYTNACAMLLSSEETRPEIKTMIRWHLEELAFDEEEYLEAEEEKKREQLS
ncbi:hypothetical protein IV203_001571 [Nitzschia inconspicua]|uniref:Uncharacterized protein n=1 Tax=Nitzschia inconspicua TaxID=303405 RepID=A0A9K3L6W3_9STRA|nr:hypothetical protein IV203_001571 [Nitzschia inconspicua]